MIADLRGQTVLLAEVESPLREAFEAAFLRHGARCLHARDDALAETLKLLHCEGDGLDVLIGGSALRLPRVSGPEDYDAEALTRVATDGVWPVFARLQRAREIFGRYPRCVIALSASAPERFEDGMDLCAAAEAMLEALCRYANHWLSAEGARMNILRHDLTKPRAAGPSATPEEIANAAVALCSGLLNSMGGQVLTVDRGASFCDNPFRDYDRLPTRGK